MTAEIINCVACPLLHKMSHWMTDSFNKETDASPVHVPQKITGGSRRSNKHIHLCSCCQKLADITRTGTCRASVAVSAASSKPSIAKLASTNSGRKELWLSIHRYTLLTTIPARHPRAVSLSKMEFQRVPQCSSCGDTEMITESSGSGGNASSLVSSLFRSHEQCSSA